MGLYIAIQFLTRIPLPQIQLNEKKISSSLPFFPLAGVLIGYFTALVYIVSDIFFSHSIVSAITVTFGIIITGGMHLDGFADTLDGIFCYGSSERKLQAMKDSRIGAYGVLGLILIVLLKYAIIFSLPKEHIFSALIVCKALSRWMMVVSIVFFPYIRKNGLGKAFSKQNPIAFLWASIFAGITVLLIIGMKGIFVAAGVIAAGLIFTEYLRRQLGGLTGDTYGAVNEFSEVVALLIFSAIIF